MVEVMVLHLIAGNSGTAPLHTPRSVTSSTELSTPYVSDLPPIRISASGLMHRNFEVQRPLRHLWSAR